MKNRRTLLLICSLVPFLIFSSRTTGDLKETVKKAAIVGTGIIESVEKTESRCSSTISAKIKVLSILKGSLNGKELRLESDEHYWRKGFWPWEKDCPSVHYKVPPLEIKLIKGEKIVFAADHFSGYKECYVTAAAALDRLDEIKRYAGLD